MRGIFLAGSALMMNLLTKGEVNRITFLINLEAGFHVPFGRSWDTLPLGTACESTFGVTVAIGPLLVADTFPLGGGPSPLTMCAKWRPPPALADEGDFTHVSPEVTSGASEPHGRGPLWSRLHFITSQGLGRQGNLLRIPGRYACPSEKVFAPRRYSP